LSARPGIQYNGSGLRIARVDLDLEAHHQDPRGTA
jgi:hypothetical protein